MRTVPLSQFMPYGAPELLGSARRHMTQALLAGSALCTLAFVLVGVGLTLHPPAAPPIVIEPPIPGHVVLPPPSPDAQPMRPPQVRPRVADAGIPVPVPKFQGAEPDATTPVTTSGDPLPANPGIETGAGKEPGPAIVTPPADEAPPMDENSVDELPIPVQRVTPEYPDLARAALVSGLVLTRILVGNDGRVHDVQLDREHNVPMLNQAAIEAARRWVFKPARYNGHIVSVWVSLPFRFKLQ